MNKYYEEIKELREADEFIKVIEKWNTLSENMGKVNIKNIPIFLPDMFLVARSGVGRTKLIRLMSEFLYSAGNLMDFYGDVKFFEFLLAYCAKGEPFTELQRLMYEMQNAQGFRNEFKGVIHIDVTEWLRHYEEPHFISFMEYISSFSEKIMIVLSVTDTESESLADFEAFISMYLRLEIVKLSLPSTETLVEHAKKNLSAYGFCLSEGGERLIFDTVDTLRKNKYFDGYKTIQMLCQDIVYSVFTRGAAQNSILCEDILSEFSADSDYVKRTSVRIERAKRIGFNA